MAVTHNINVTATDKTGQALSKIDKKLGNIDNKAGSVTKALGAAGAAALAFTSSGILSGMVKQYTAFEKYNTVLATYLGSQGKANAEMKRLQQLANALPQDLNDITQAFVLFTSRGIDTTSKSLTAFSNIATANGKSLTQLGEAVADALTGEFERMKEFGIKVSKENGKFVADIGNGNKMVANSAKELMDQLRALGEEGGKFGNAAKNNANTLAQSFSNLTGAVMESSVAFGSGAKSGLKTFADTLSQVMRQNEGTMQRLGQIVGNMATTLAKAFVFVVDHVAMLKAAMLSLIVMNIAKYAIGAATAFGVFGKSVGLAGAALKSFKAAMIKNVIGALIALGFYAADAAGILDKVYEKLGLMGEKDTLSPLVDNLAQVNKELEKYQSGGMQRNAWSDQANETALALQKEIYAREDLLKVAQDQYAQALKNGTVDVEALNNINQLTDSIQNAQSVVNDYIKARAAANKPLTISITPNYSEAEKNLIKLSEEVDANTAKEKLRVETLRLVNKALGDTSLSQERHNSLLQVSKMLMEGHYTAAQVLIQGLVDQNAELKSYEAALKNIAPLIAGTTVSEQQARTALEEKIKSLKDAGKETATYDTYLRDLKKSIMDERQTAEWATKAQWELVQMRAEGKISADELTKALERLNGAQADSAGTSVLKDLTAQAKRLDELRDAYANADQIVQGSTVSAEAFREELQKQINALVPVREGLVVYESEHAKMAKAVQENWKNIGEQMSQSMSDAVAKGELTFNSFKDFLKGWAQQIVSQIIKKTLMDPITNQLASLGASIVSGVGGGAGGGIASMLGSLFGGGGMSGSIFDLFSGSFLGFANGGMPPVGQPSIVGENGPELFVPKSAGTVVPNDALGGGALNVNFTIQAIDSKSGTEFILNNKQQIVGVIQDAYNRRGKQGIY